MGVDIDRVRAAYDEIGCVELVDFKEWPPRDADALVTMIDNMPDMLAELAASRQRIAELEARFTEMAELSLKAVETVKYIEGIAVRGSGTPCPDHLTISQFVLAYVKGLEATLASREAALRDVAHLLGPWTESAEGRPRGLTAAVKLAHDRAAREVGR